MREKKITYREYHNSDLKAVLDLWEHFSGWGRPDEDEFKEWLKTPFGKVFILLAIDHSGEVIGQVFYTPTNIYLEGKKLRGVKISSPIIHKDYRSGNIDIKSSLIINLLLEGEKILKERGIDWVYALPAKGWEKIMKIAHIAGASPWATGRYRCLEVVGEYPILNQLILKALDSFPKESNLVWNNFKNAQKSHSFVTRDSKWLKYKWGGDLKIGFYNESDTLIGYAVVQEDTGLLLDLSLSNTQKIGASITALKMFLDDFYKKGNQSSPGLKFMDIEFFRSHLSEVECKELDYQFAFGLSYLKNLQPTFDQKLSNWIVFPKD